MSFSCVFCHTAYFIDDEGDAQGEIGKLLSSDDFISTSLTFKCFMTPGIYLHDVQLQTLWKWQITLNISGWPCPCRTLRSKRAVSLADCYRSHQWCWLGNEEQHATLSFYEIMFRNKHWLFFPHDRILIPCIHYGACAIWRIWFF